MQLNLESLDLPAIIQSFKPLFFVKWIFVLLLLGYIVFQFVVFRQIKAMEKIITQPISSTIVAFISLLFIAAGAIVILIVWSAPI